MMVASAFAADCPDAPAAVDEAAELILYADLAGAQAALGRAAFAHGCGPPAAAMALGRMWLVEGAIALDSGDPAAAATAFLAARRVAPGLWIDLLAPAKRSAYDAAVAPTGAGHIAVDVAGGGAATVWIDGAPMAAPISVAPGKHLVQVGAADRAWFAQVVLVSADEVKHVASPAAPAAAVQVDAVASSVSAPIPAPADAAAAPVEAAPAPASPVPASPALVPSPVPRVRPYPHLAVGVDFAFGGTVDDVLQRRPTDPATLALVPLELGGGALGKWWWARAAAAVAPVLSGQLLYVGDGGVDREADVAAGGHISAGGSLGPIDLGLLAGYRWPELATARLVVGLRAPAIPVELELRGGANFAATGARAPAASVLLVFPGTASTSYRR